MSPKFCPLIKESCKQERCALWDYNNCLIYLYLGSNIALEFEDDEDQKFISSNFDKSFLKKLKDLDDPSKLDDFR
jgi:hypothetical protein